MALLLEHTVELPRPCSYLPDREAALESMVMRDVSPEEYQHLLERGWRRFGPVYFRPACEACRECVSLRIPTATFRPNRSQRRARAAFSRFRRVVGPPRVDEARLALYRAWHAQREEAREWAPSSLTAREYAFQFAFPHPSAREVAYYDDEAPGGPRLVALGLCDEMPQAWSAVYFFYDPEYARRSPGTANVVYQVELARERAIPYVYLGYRVLGCPSLRYKAHFRPHELLHERPGFREAPPWRPAEAATPSSSEAGRASEEE